MTKKKICLFLFIIVMLIIIILYFFGFTKSTYSFYPLNNIHLSEDGSKLYFSVMSEYIEHIPMLRKIKTKKVDNRILITFYTNRILLSFFRTDEFKINIDSSCNEIYFYKGLPNQEYYLAIKKNEVSNKWERVPLGEWPNGVIFYNLDK